jgi:nitroreductase
MVRLMRQRIAEMHARGEATGSAEHSVAVMAQAPVTVFIFNPDGLHPWLPRTVEQTFSELVDTQSIGAAIQNMLLAAQDVGLGSLWICDVFYAYEELRDWLGEEGQMIAAVALGYPDEQPGPRPRKPLDTVLRWV